MDYSIVIATRNRLEALKLSVPRMLSQSRPPKQLIVIDSSDDHAPVAGAVQEIAARFPAVELIIKHSERGSTIQRNTGLELVKEPIVFFPDDDSILYPGTAEEIMAVYERDTNTRIAAVCAAESKEAPPDFSAKRANYKMNAADKLKIRVQRFRSIVEQYCFPDPCAVWGKGCFSTFPLDSVQKQNSVVPVAWMTGFRMTFRTDAIRRHKFDTNLKRYALFEDRDASFKAWREGAVVGALKARIFHYRSPEKRDNGRIMGSQQLLNLAYLTAVHCPKNHPARKRLMRFARYKTLLYLLSAKDTFSKERYKGAREALAILPLFIDIESDKAASLYNSFLQKFS